MAHKLYLVNGLIIKSWPSGESNKIFLVLTDTLGLIKVSAQAIRDGKSKLRGHLQTGKLAKLELVRGRELWRLVGASGSAKVLPSDEKSRQVLARVARLMQRLVPLDEPNHYLYEDVVSSFKILNSSSDFLSVETLLVLRLLYNLGYFDPSPKFTDVVVHGGLVPSMLENFSTRRSEAIKLINESLAGGHL